MGFRTNFYHIPITEIRRMENMNSEEFNTSGYDNIHRYVNRDCKLLYDAFTNSILEIADNTEYCSKLFKSTTMDEIDQLYRTMNKEQFVNFIKYVMKKEIEYQQSHCIRFDEIDKLKDELQNGFNPDNNDRFNSYEKLPVIHKFIYNQTNINLCADWYAQDLTFIDELLNDKWAVSHSWQNQCAIFNLIHIYHMMNWDQEQILIIGG